ncbi:hypothetical protein AgCh_008385 [Apium graveolens]
MQIALNARNKFVLVNGLYKKPAITSPLYAQWERVNDMIITCILNSVADEISDGLNYVTTASGIWTELYERFSSVNGHSVYQIMKDTHSLEQGNRSIETYFHKLKSLWDEYAVLEPTGSNTVDESPSKCFSSLCLDPHFLQSWYHYDIPDNSVDNSTIVDQIVDVHSPSSHSDSIISPADSIINPVESPALSDMRLDTLSGSPPDSDSLITSDFIDSDNVNVVVPRHSTRSRTRPSWWHDYSIPGHNSCSSVSKYPISSFVSCHSFYPQYSAFRAKIISIKEPTSFAKAVLDSNWITNMNKDLEALESNKTWTLVSLPVGKKTIGCKWVFKIKYLPNGDIERYKARLVAKGYTQEHGVDFHDTFAPVAKDFHEEVYMDVPPGYKIPSSPVPLVCKLQKSFWKFTAGV